MREGSGAWIAGARNRLEILSCLESSLVKLTGMATEEVMRPIVLG